MKALNPTYRDIMKIALPIAFSLLIPQISFLANTYFVAKLNKLDLAALGMVSVYYLLLTWLSYGLSNGLLVVLSRKAGQNDSIVYGRSFQSGILLSIILAIFLLVTTLIFNKFFYQLVLSDISVINASVAFMNYRIWGLPFLVMSHIINVLFISNGSTKWLIIGSIAGNFINIILDYGLIFGHLGLPEMGLIGAAIASITAECVYFIVMCIIIIVLKLHRKYNLFSEFKPHKQTYKEIMHISSPLIFQYIFSIGGWQLFFIYVEHLGQAPIAATHILRNILGIIGIGAWSFASTSNTLTSNLIGQGRVQAVYTGLKKLVVSSGVFGLFISILLITFGDWILQAFTQDIEILHYSRMGLKILYGTSILMCVSTVLFNVVIGIGKTTINMLIEVSCVLMYVAFITLIFRYWQLGFFAGWMSEYLYWGLLLILSAWYFYRSKWQNKFMTSLQ